MANFVFNISKGRLAHYASLPATSDSLLVIPLEQSGLEADAILRDKDTLADVLAGTTNEQTTLGRKTATNVVVTVDDANDRVDVDLADVTWTAATGNSVGAIVLAYKPSATSADAAIIPMTKHDYQVTPNGGDISVIIPAAGLYRIT